MTPIVVNMPLVVDLPKIVLKIMEVFGVWLRSVPNNKKEFYFHN